MKKKNRVTYTSYLLQRITRYSVIKLRGSALCRGTRENGYTKHFEKEVQDTLETMESNYFR